jgi:hypothetical protein
MQSSHLYQEARKHKGAARTSCRSRVLEAAKEERGSKDQKRGTDKSCAEEERICWYGQRFSFPGLFLQGNHAI